MVSRKFKKRIYVLVVVIITVLLFSGCCILGRCINTALDSASDIKGGIPDPGSNLREEQDASAKELVLSYLIAENLPYYEMSVYFAEDTPETPEEGDCRIESMEYVGETRLHESIEAAYRLEVSGYSFFRKDENSEGEWIWNKQEPFYIVIQRSASNDTWERVVGRNYHIDPEKSTKEAILEIVYGLHDIEVSFILDAHTDLIGPGSTPDLLKEDHISEILEEWEPRYAEGDYWIVYRYDGLEAFCYHTAAEETDRIVKLETTRTDVSTYRGIRVGDDREEVLKKYPDIHDEPYWCLEGDYLWYSDSGEGLGPVLLFWFTGDKVSRIELGLMFD